jgi:hypothetical protein
MNNLTFIGVAARSAVKGRANVALAAVAAVLLSFSLPVGCKENTPKYNTGNVPVTPYFVDRVGIVVKNAAGNNLLDPNVEGNIISSNEFRNIIVEHDGKSYRPVLGFSPENGLWISAYSQTNRTIMLTFGPLYPGSPDRQTLDIEWWDDSRDLVEFEYQVTGGEDGVAESVVEESKIWLNGVAVSDKSLVVEIVK